jgi:DNA-binding HxlR family transcriptional regulator
MTQYNHDIDDAILSYLYKNEKANFSQLLQQVGRSHKGISRKVLSSHLKKLEEDKIIRRDKERLGAERFSYLTKLTRQQVSLGIHVQAKSKREHRASALEGGGVEGSAIKRKKMYQLLFFIAASGAGRLKPNPKPEPGDIGLYGADGKLAAYSYYNIRGVGASDFSVEPREIIGQDGALTDVVADLSLSEIASLFEVLLKENPWLIKPIDVGGETRYRIANESRADYIADCGVLF